MREIDAIISKYEHLKEKLVDCVMATVVHVEGSSYRRAGARMLIDEFGNITGAISGGCLEGDALRKALHSLHQRKNKLVTYDTGDEDAAVIGAQLGCDGIIQVLFEPINYQDDLNPCELLKMLIGQNSSKAIVVQYDLNKTKEQSGTILLVSEGSDVIGKKPNMNLYDHMLVQAGLSLKSNTSHFAEFSLENHTYQIFVQIYKPPVKLVIVGAGNDAQILAQQANILGWDVIVTDGRPSHANKTRFTTSCQIIVSKPENTLDNISLDNRSCCVLMSHNYNYDLSVLKLLLKEDVIPYIGILGPLKKHHKMLEELEQDGIILKQDVLNKIFAPIGLEIGAETPAEIGLSILAEIQAVLTGKSARSLREKTEPIHDTLDHKFKQIQI